MRRTLTSRQIAQMVDDVLEARWLGWCLDPTAEAAQMYGVSPSTVRRVLYKRGAYRTRAGHPLCNDRLCISIANEGKVRCPQHESIDRDRKWEAA